MKNISNDVYMRTMMLSTTVHAGHNMSYVPQKTLLNRKRPSGRKMRSQQTLRVVWTIQICVLPLSKQMLPARRATTARSKTPYRDPKRNGNIGVEGEA